MLKLKHQCFSHLSEELTHWERPWCWERWKAEGEGEAEDEMVGWHHRLNGLEFVQTPGDGEGQGSLVCCSPWGPKQLGKTERLTHNVSVGRIRRLRESHNNAYSEPGFETHFLTSHLPI
ncbi:unnamed protein product [Rangifer tarandus platyrhynchus]|uniref:Uncharacterized protein n=1 Tax=Rangifer tarandus platyrhynchus TaxID=3082113 RepID=A0AC60A1T1_RANTA